MLDGFSGKMVEIEVRFSARAESQTSRSARIKSFSVQHLCEKIE